MSHFSSPILLPWSKTPSSLTWLIAILYPKADFPKV